MSAGLSSDAIVKREIVDKVKTFPNIRLKIFTDGSNEDQKLIEDGGLTFSYKGINYGSCDAVWFIIDADGNETPLIGLEGTAALERGSSGNAQYQRFHHAMGAVLNGYIGIYYLREGDDTIRLDLNEMAYQATKNSANGGAYLIVQDLSVINTLLQLIHEHGRQAENVKDYLENYIENMHKAWYDKEFSKYKHSWDIFANKRSTIIFDDFIVKYSGRSKRNFTDTSQRAGHIAVGEMYLSKYFFYGKKVIYLWPKMNKEDVEYLDQNKVNDKEWIILRSEKDVEIKTRDDIKGLPKKIYDDLESIKDKPLKNGTEARRIYNACIEVIVQGIKDGSLQIQ